MDILAPVSKQRPALPGIALEVLSGAAALYGLYLISLHHYLLFHALVELFGIAIGVSLFRLTWNSRRILENSYLPLIGHGLSARLPTGVELAIVQHLIRRTGGQVRADGIVNQGACFYFALLEKE